MTDGFVTVDSTVPKSFESASWEVTQNPEMLFWIKIAYTFGFLHHLCKLNSSHQRYDAIWFFSTKSHGTATFILIQEWFITRVIMATF